MRAVVKKLGEYAINMRHYAIYYGDKVFGQNLECVRTTGIMQESVGEFLGAFDQSLEGERAQCPQGRGGFGGADQGFFESGGY